MDWRLVEQYWSGTRHLGCIPFWLLEVKGALTIAYPLREGGNKKTCFMEKTIVVTGFAVIKNIQSANAKALTESFCSFRHQATRIEVNMYAVTRNSTVRDFQNDWRSFGSSFRKSGNGCHIIVVPSRAWEHKTLQRYSDKLQRKALYTLKSISWTTCK